ncbi:unnamed protein product [Sphagnum balticum]
MHWRSCNVAKLQATRLTLSESDDQAQPSYLSNQGYQNKRYIRSSHISYAPKRQNCAHPRCLNWKIQGTARIKTDDGSAETRKESLQMSLHEWVLEMWSRRTIRPWMWRRCWKKTGVRSEMFLSGPDESKAVMRNRRRSFYSHYLGLDAPISYSNALLHGHFQNRTISSAEPWVPLQCDSGNNDTTILSFINIFGGQD